MVIFLFISRGFCICILLLFIPPVISSFNAFVVARCPLKDSTIDRLYLHQTESYDVQTYKKMHVLVEHARAEICSALEQVL